MKRHHRNEYSEAFWCDHSVWLNEWLRATAALSTWMDFMMDKYKQAPVSIRGQSLAIRTHARIIDHVFMDAKDTSTGQIVAMKIIRHEDNPDELAIATFLTSEEKSSDHRNHCVPILRILSVPDEEGHVIIVMPYLCLVTIPSSKPSVKGFGSSERCFRDSNSFGNDVVHRDGGFTNIMMDATSMYGPDIVRDIDHGLSDPRDTTSLILVFRFTINLTTCRPLCARMKEGTSRFPNFSSMSQIERSEHRSMIHSLSTSTILGIHSGFFAQVEADYELGEEGLCGMEGFEFMEPLIAAMTEPDPLKRIKIKEAIRRFARIEKGLSAIALRSRVAYNTDFTIFRPFKYFGHWVWTLGLVAHGTPPHSIPKSRRRP
ncbi:hypothetical protein EDD85DRAFT_1017805 [Armillaria nabsnona]|nr:hypothetical protein EDD85DRAFT_1017805 [Armillaria nabsnona]